MPAVVVAVIGPGGPSVDPDHLRIATEVGAGIAEAGATLVCGGLDGVMAAASEGARRAGGVVLGLLPGSDRDAGNPYLSIAIPTGLGEARNALIIRTADAVIAIGGGYGTLSEIGFALKTGRAVIGIDTWELRRDGGVDHGIVLAETAGSAVGLALQKARA
jgi:uncharacterized protein (TIGR00725 family)